MCCFPPKPTGVRNVGVCSVLLQLITCSMVVMIRTELVLSAGTACCQRVLGSTLFHLFPHSCCSVSELITEFLHISLPLYVKKITFPRMSQKSGKQRRRAQRMFCFWSTTATAGAFCLHCAQDSEPSGKADTGSSLNPLSSTPAINSGGLTGSCHTKPSAWKPVKEVGLFRSVI